MTHYIDTARNLYFLDDETFAHLLPAGCVPVSDAEAEALRAPSPDDALEQTQAALTAAIQAHLDSTSQTHNYDGILSLCSYASSKNSKFQAEGVAGVDFRDKCWAYGYQVIADVHAGLRGIPTPEGLVAELPAMVWPS